MAVSAVVLEVAVLGPDRGRRELGAQKYGAGPFSACRRSPDQGSGQPCMVLQPPPLVVDEGPIDSEPFLSYPNSRHAIPRHLPRVQSGVLVFLKVAIAAQGEP